MISYPASVWPQRRVHPTKSSPFIKLKLASLVKRLCESVNRDHSSHLAHKAFTQVRLQLSDAIAKAASAIFSRHFVYGKFPNSYPTYPGGTPPPQTLRVNQRPALPKSAAQIRSRECLQADIKRTKYLFPKKCVSKVEWTFFEGRTIQLIN